MKYFSMFSGVGGFERGIENATNNKWECVGFSEIDKHAVSVYKKHYNHKNLGNARDIKPEELPNFDMLCGGFPCQSFSIAGKRKGFQDTRGTLFHEILRIAKAKRPRLLFLENVKGLLSADDGRCFHTIISSLDELGYDVEWQVLNSKNFGVPQNRERVFIIGHLRGERSGQVLPLKQRSRETEDFIMQLNNPTHSKQPKIVSHSLFPRSSITNEGGTGHLSKEDNTSYCLDSGNCQAIECGDSERSVRRLTPTECERLQSFPDGWTKHGVDENGKIIEISDTQKYKMMGNAVTTNVIQAIVEQMLRVKA